MGAFSTQLMNRMFYKGLDDITIQSLCFFLFVDKFVTHNGQSPKLNPRYGIRHNPSSCIVMTFGSPLWRNSIQIQLVGLDQAATYRQNDYLKWKWRNKTSHKNLLASSLLPCIQCTQLCVCLCTMCTCNKWS